MTWNRRRTLIVGVVLILVTNTVALGGAAYNRSGEPEAVLTLTQRELWLPYNWGFEGENSGMALTLKWRTLGMEGEAPDLMTMFDRGIASEPDWLDKEKLAALGFDVAMPENTPEGYRHYDRQLPKEVLLVLELNGPAYQRQLERTRQQAARELSLLNANRGNPEFERRAKAAREQLKAEEQGSSRLFVIDAGVDRATLRARYPDHKHYAIVRGQIRPRIMSRKKLTWLSGYISNLSTDHINVPLDHQAVFGPPGQRRNADKRYTVSVAFGKRLEPWMTTATDNGAAGKDEGQAVP